MMHGRSFITALALLFSTSVMAQSPAPDVINHQAPGSLETTQPLSCVGLAAIKSSHTPPDIFHGVVECSTQQRTADMISMYMLANMYARFDTFRVSDKTAHQAVTVMQMGLGEQLGEEGKSHFFTALQAAVDNPATLAATCTQIRRIGPPEYHPSYMIQHGMGAFIGNQGDGLEANFDSAAIWQRLLTDYLKCGEA
jgi:hypothetical protein